MRTHLLLLLTLLAQPIWGQDDPDSKPLFIERIDVDVVNVEVFVTDKEGRRVTDLGLDDFELLEDGKPVEITNFYSAFRENFAERNLKPDALKGSPFDQKALQGSPFDQPAPQEAAPQPTEGTAKTAETGETEAPAEDQRLNLVIYVDHLSLRPADRTRVIEALEGFVEERLRQGDRILLEGFDGTLETVQPFTTDLESLHRGLQEMSKVSAVRRADDGLRNRTMRLMAQAQADAPPDPQSALSYLRSYAQLAESDVQRATGALKAAVQGLAGLPGRKALVYVTGGWPMRPGEDLYQFFLDLFSEAGLRGQVINPTAEIQRYDQSFRFREIAREANAQQVTLYSIDARGTSNGVLRADNPALSRNPGGATLLESQRVEGAREGLFSLADATGGSVAFETFDFAGVFETLAQDFDGYYSLGFRSRHVGDGENHKIDVKVGRPGLKVRHRGGFLDKPPEERVADRTLAALLLGAGKNPLGVSVKLGTPKKDGRTWIVPVLVAVPVASVTVVPDGDKMRGRLRFLVAIRDENGTSEPHSEIYPVEFHADAYEAARDQSLGYTVRLNVKAGAPTVAVSVWDEVADTESIVLEAFRVGEP